MGGMSDLALEIEESKLYQRHSDTSYAAAKSMRGKLTPLHVRILVYLQICPLGATDESIQLALNIPQNTERPRRRELELAGKIKDSGRTQRTKSGRKAVLWIINAPEKVP